MSTRVVIENLRLEVGESLDALDTRLKSKLKLGAHAPAGYQIVRRALDARRKNDIHWIYHVACELPSDASERLLARGLARLPGAKVRDPLDRGILDGLVPGKRSPGGRPLVIGSGPAGLFAAWLLAREGYAPIVIERGPRVEHRVRKVNAFDRGGPHDPEANILYGEGGAGTFSDGKLTFRGRTPLVGLIHELMIGCKAPEEIRYAAKPHVGTDRLRAVLVFFRRELERLGTEFRFDARVDDLLLGSDGQVAGVRLADGSELHSAAVILGIGHSARDTYAMLRERGVALEFKPFQLGLRIEHPQVLIDRAQFGPKHAELPSAEYVLNDRKRGVFSFCMCPGGTLMASVSEAEHLCSNGMSRRKRDSGLANSGLVFTISEQDVVGEGRDPLAGIALQRRLEATTFKLGGSDYCLPAQRVQDFLRGKLSRGPLESTYPRGVTGADLNQVLPPHGAREMRESLKLFGRKIPGYSGADGLLVGVESRGSSPVRIPRGLESRESSSTPGLFPVGEGAGFAGGIMSAAVDGMRSAAALVQAFAKPS